MSDSEPQSAGHHLSTTSSVPDAGEDVVLEQGHDGRLNPDDTVGPISSPRGSTLSLAVSVPPVSPVASAQTALVPYIPPSGAA